MEYSLRDELNVQNAHKLMTIREGRMMKIIENDEEVRFCWVLASSVIGY